MRQEMEATRDDDDNVVVIRVSVVLLSSCFRLITEMDRAVSAETHSASISGAVNS